MTSINSKVSAKINDYILNAIDSEAYGIETNTVKEKLQFLADTFKKEYCFPQNLQRYKTVQNVLSEWIQGLPSTFNIDFYNYKIIEVAKTFGNLPEQLSEKEEDKVISNWFSFIAAKTLQLFAKNGIPTSYFVS